MTLTGGIDIVVVNWNAGDLLKRCLESVLAGEAQHLLHTIVLVDNASSDDSLSRVPADNRIKVIRNEVNKGFAFACNQGIEICNSEYVVMVNPDVVLERNTLRLSYEFMQANTNVDVMGCRQVDDNQKIQPSCSRFPTPGRFWNDALGLSKLLPGMFKPASLMTDWDHRSSGFVDQIIGSYMFIRRKALEKTGHFDTRFFVYYEELDLSKRLAEAGGKSYYNSDIQLVHSCNGTTEKVKAFRLFLSLNSRMLYSQKHFSRAGRVSTYIATMFAEPVSRLVFSFFKGGLEDASNTLAGYKMTWKKWLLGKQVEP